MTMATEGIGKTDSGAGASVADDCLDRLKVWGIHRIYGYPGDVGACIATSGPGAIHLLSGLYDAKLDHQPVVAIVGQQKRYKKMAQSALEGDPEAGGIIEKAIKGKAAEIKEAIESSKKGDS